MREEVIGQIIANSIMTTALLANELCIQTKGELIIPEADYLTYVKDFQVIMSRSLTPVLSQEKVKEEAKKYISSLLSKYQESEDATNSSTGDSEQTSNSIES